MMSKGPIGLIIPIIPIIALILIKKHWNILKEINWLSGLIAFIIITLPWVVYVSIHLGLSNVISTIYRETGERYFSAFDHIKPFKFYFTKLDGLFFPWIWVFIIFVIAHIVSIFRNPKLKLKEYYSELIHSKNDKVLFLIVWFLGGLLFLSLTKAKRYYYILSITPAFALLVSVMWNFFVNEALMKKFRLNKIWFPLLILLIGLVFLFLSFGNFNKVDNDLSGDHTPNSFELFLFFGILFIGLSLNSFLSKLKNLNTDYIFYIIIVAMAITMITYTILVVPLLNVENSTKEFCKYITTNIPKEIPLVTYDEINHSQEFYTNRYIEMIKDPDKLDKYFNENKDSYAITTVKLLGELDNQKYTIITRTPNIKNEKYSWVLFKKK